MHNASDTYHAQFADASLSDLAIDNDDSHQCPQSQSDFFSWDQWISAPPSQFYYSTQSFYYYNGSSSFITSTNHCQTLKPRVHANISSSDPNQWNGKDNSFFRLTYLKQLVANAKYRIETKTEQS